MREDGPERLSRRSYMKLGVAVGGAAGLSACMAWGDADMPRGDPDARPTRQHAWNAALGTDDDGNRLLPDHHVLLGLDLVDDPPEEAREIVESSLRRLEEAYAYDADGLLFAIGYSPSYFDRIDTDRGRLPRPRALSDLENPELDDMDAIVHLASNTAQIVLEAEEALFGETGPNGLDPVSVGPVFERASPRRTGFVGEGLPANERNHDSVPDAVPDGAPFLMGFRSGFAESQAPEDRVSIPDGPFAEGSTLHVESSTINLRQWFEQDTHDQRVAKTFSPAHADEGIGEIGEELGTSTGAREQAERTSEDARTQGIVGHAQKAARARDADGTPPLLRRDFNTIDNGQPGLHFVSYQREIAEFERVREAMTGTDLAGSGVGARLNNGILQYVHVQRRGNYLVPPRSRRALPIIGERT